MAQGRIEDAHLVVARVNARGDKTDPRVVVEFQRIVDALHMDKAVAAKAMSPKELIRTPTARRRLAIGASPGLFSCIAGNIIASYYLGQSLTQSGITDRNDQLKAVSHYSRQPRSFTDYRQNVVLNVWCLACCLAGTQLAVRWGRKSTALTAQFLLTGLLFTIGGLTKRFSANPEGASQALIYGNVACIFLFQGAYSIAWTPLSVYPLFTFVWEVSV